MIKLMDKKIVAILRLNILLNWSNVVAKLSIPMNFIRILVVHIARKLWDLFELSQQYLLSKKIIVFVVN